MELVRRDTDYALRAMIHLAHMREERKVTARELGKSQEIPLSFCHKILRRLVAAGLVASQPGRTGGFQLNRPPKTVRFYDIVTAVQGPVAVSHCMIGRDACPRQPTCPVSRKWKRLQQDVITFLKETRLADVFDGRKA